MDDPDYVPAITGISDEMNVPWMYRWTRISHYYGDAVRELLIAAAVLMLVCAPFYSDDIQTELPFIVIGTLVLACVAALTSPKRKSIISADAVAAGVGLVIFEMWALLGYSDSTAIQFILRESIAIIFLFALYFSTKTLRAMFSNTIGTVEESEEYMEIERPTPHATAPKEKHSHQHSDRNMSKHDLREMNEHEKIDFTD